MEEKNALIVHPKAVLDPEVPERFGSLNHARVFSQTFSL